MPTVIGTSWLAGGRLRPGNRVATALFCSTITNRGGIFGSPRIQIQRSSSTYRLRSARPAFRAHKRAQTPRFRGGAWDTRSASQAGISCGPFADRSGFGASELTQT